jgi:hypothetical protein
VAARRAWRASSKRAGAAPPRVDAQRDPSGCSSTNALKRRRLIDLDAMHPSMAKLPSHEAAALAYAEVLTLVAWLHGKVGYAGLRQALALQAGGKSARRALAEVTDSTWLGLEKEWRAHLRTLDLSGGRAVGVRNAKQARIRFGKGGAR